MDNKIQLKEGDLFAVRSKGVLSYAIRAVQWWWSTDNESLYNHVGIITSPSGATLEALWVVGDYKLSKYAGHPILIVRHKDMTFHRFLMGMYAVLPDKGKMYPLWRLPLHALHIAKLFPFGTGVCSETTGKFMEGAGFANIVYGITPDDLADKWRIDRDMSTIFEGVLTKDILY